MKRFWVKFLTFQTFKTAGGGGDGRGGEGLRVRLNSGHIKVYKGLMKAR